MELEISKNIQLREFYKDYLLINLKKALLEVNQNYINEYNSKFLKQKFC
jgi:hypothetical protein